MRKVSNRKVKLKKKSTAIQREKLVRNNRITLVLNDKEKEALDGYCKKYNIDSKSQFIRETIFRHIMERFLSDYPTLFEKEELDSLVVNEPRQTSLF